MEKHFSFIILILLLILGCQSPTASQQTTSTNGTVNTQAIYVFTETTTYAGHIYQAGDQFPGIPTNADIVQLNLETQDLYKLTHS